MLREKLNLSVSFCEINIRIGPCHQKHLHSCYSVNVAVTILRQWYSRSINERGHWPEEMGDRNERKLRIQGELRLSSVQSTSKGLISDILLEHRKASLYTFILYTKHIVKWLHRRWNNKRHHIKSILITSSFCNLKAIVARAGNQRCLFGRVREKPWLG